MHMVYSQCLMEGDATINLTTNEERCSFIVSAMWTAPANTLHLQWSITDVDKPLILYDCKPFGSGDIGGLQLV
jgi:hypothetical protein